MTDNEIISTLEVAKTEVEWNYPMDYQMALDGALNAVKAVKDIKQLMSDKPFFFGSHAYMIGWNDGIKETQRRIKEVLQKYCEGYKVD